MFQLVLRKQNGISKLVPAPLDAQSSRARRWVRKSAVDKLFWGSRYWKCHRWKLPGESIKTMYSQEYSRAFYAGLQVCASVHACPLCRSKIAEHRRGEVQTAISTAQAKGLRVLMFTQTVPHGLGDNLDELTAKIMDAQARFTSDRAARAWRDAIGVVGAIRALEVTHGENGWHPHFHTIVFLKNDGGLSIEEIQKSGSALWQHCAQAAGLPQPHEVHGFNVQDGAAAGAYVTKWGMAEEVTKGASKAARGKGYTPEQLLDLYAQGDKQAGALFVAYVEAFKGKSSLRWSRGLKAMFGIAEKSDKESAEDLQQQTESETVATITSRGWAYLVAKGWQSLLLHYVERDRAEALEFIKCAEREAVSRQGQRALAAAAKPAESVQLDDPDPSGQGRGGAASVRAANDERQRGRAARARPSGRQRVGG